MKVDKILKEKITKKPRMDECRVFRVDIGAIPPSDIPVVLNQAKEMYAEDFDISHVIFVPVRGDGSLSGWQ